MQILEQDRNKLHHHLKRLSFTTVNTWDCQQQTHVEVLYKESFLSAYIALSVPKIEKDRDRQYDFVANMAIIRESKSQGDTVVLAKKPLGRWNKFLLLLSIFVHIIIPGSFYVVAIPENTNIVHDRKNLPTEQHQTRNEYVMSKSSNSGDSSGGDDNNGIIQIIESEVWDASENAWKGANRGNRWANENGHHSPSPAEVVPPDGWQFLGDWKIVVNSSSSSNNNNAGMGGIGGGDSKGWEYSFQYLQPPKRRRIWLRSLTPMKLPPSRVVPKPPPIPASRTKVKKARRISRLARTMRLIRDDWNYKGLGLNLYKSFIFPSSAGVAIRLPLSTNFDTFDRNPAWPIISSSAAVFYPPMMAGFLSTSVHVEWVKWMTKRMLGLIPLTLFWVLYRIVLPILWMAASVPLFPLRSIYTLPPRPNKIPNGSWWTGRNIAKPQYNSDMSERIGCSVSYRWSKKRGYEFRVNYWHAYLPTLLVYQQFLSQVQERLKGTFASGSSKAPSASSALSSSSSLLSKTETEAKNDWLRKHTAALGVSTSGPIADTPAISCSANFSLSGLYWGARQVLNRNSISTPPVTNTGGSKAGNMMASTSGSDESTSVKTEKEYEDLTTASTTVRTPSMRKSSSLS